MLNTVAKEETIPWEGGGERQEEAGVKFTKHMYHPLISLPLTFCLT